jgi:hypothetical protein
MRVVLLHWPLIRTFGAQRNILLCEAKSAAADKNKVNAMESPSVTRKGSPPVKVYCLPEERRQIEASAKAAGLSVSSYLLHVGLGYRIQGIVDYQHVRELARINGGLGRLGGLLKLWLTDDVRTAKFGESTIRAVLSKIEATQHEMGEVMTQIVMPKAGR